MKKIAIVTCATMVALGAFAQGKVSAVNDASRLFIYSADPSKLNPSDAGRAGTGLPQDGSFSYAIWGASGTGNGENALVLVSPVFAMSTAALPAGRLGGNSVTLPTTPAFPGAAFANFQVRLWSTSAGSWQNAQTAPGAYVAKTAVFQAKPGSAAPSPLNSTGASVGSTWPVGAVETALVPEPASATIIGLGLAGLIVLRRRK